MAAAFFVFAGITPPAIELQAAKQRTPSAVQKKEAPTPPQRAPLPPREPFTVEQQATAVIPGMPDARFWSDSEADFIRALPALPGPWLILSTGGGDGAFGAGLLNGWTETGKRPSFSVVTGVSAGALMAPYAFAGSQYDKQLKDSYTSINAGDVFELGGRGESLLDTWPLKDLIAKWVTPQLVADVAIEHNRGRRLFILTTNLDAERFVVWNIGAIAARGGEPALNLIRQVLLASASIPGAFPPVLINVQAGSVRFQEMHADGGLGAQFFVAPERMLASTSTYKLPATELFIIVNTGLTRDFIITERMTITVLGRAVSAAIKAAIRALIDRTYTVAKRSGVGFNLAYVEPSFQHESHGAFDPDYMKALFAFGEEKGRRGNFFHEPPDYANPHNTGEPMK